MSIAAGTTDGGVLDPGFDHLLVSPLASADKVPGDELR